MNELQWVNEKLTHQPEQEASLQQGPSSSHTQDRNGSHTIKQIKKISSQNQARIKTHTTKIHFQHSENITKYLLVL